MRNVTANFFHATFGTYVRILTAIGNSWNAVQNYAFSNFKNVMYMDISDNHIKSIGKAFFGLEQLDSLNLSLNHIEIIKPEVFMVSLNKSRLLLLDLSYNLLTYLPEDIFVHLYNLRQLYLQGNKLTMLDGLYSVNLKNLNYLNLCCNNFTMLNITLKHFSNLKELDVSFNQFKNIDEFAVKSLERIILSHNIFEEVTLDNFARLPYLKRIDLSYNKFNKLPTSNFPQNPNGTKPLINIFLNNNNITHIDETFFINFNYINVLNLSNNEIKEIKQGTFKHAKVLKVLSVSNCGLKFLTNETFLNLENTKMIEISQNNLTSLNAKFFTQCTNLRTIIADNNFIATVDLGMFEKLVPSLARIALRSNPIAQDPSTQISESTVGSIEIRYLLQIAVDLINEIYYTILIIFFLLLAILLLIMFVPKSKPKIHLSYTLQEKDI